MITKKRNTDLFLDSTKPEVKEECKGLFFRCAVNDYMVRKGSRFELHQNVTYRLLKRRSCPGCRTCESFEEDFECAGDFSVYALPDDPINDGIYTLKLNLGPPDWETGCIDEWEWEFVLVDEHKR